MRGARAIRLIPMLLACAVLGAGIPSYAARPVSKGDRNASAGDLRFHAQAVGFRHGSEEARIEFFIRVPYPQIYFEPQEDRFAARLRLTVELWNEENKPIERQRRELDVTVADGAALADSTLGEIYALGVVLGPGTYRYKVTVEDMNVARRGLVYTMKNQKRQGSAEGLIDAGPWLFQEPALSGLELAWSIGDRSSETAFGRGPYEVFPQPSGHFGLYRDAISVYYEIYDAPPPVDGRTYRIRARVLSMLGDTLLTTADTVRVSEGSAWPHALMLDVAPLPAGHYALRLILESEGGSSAVAAVSQTEFDVLWSPESWALDASEQYDVAASALLASEGALEFRTKPLGEKERLLERIWRDVDSSPETAENEQRDEFRRRVAFANANFTVFERGMFSDRGRVYIRYGEPDEIQVERLPVGDRTLGHALGDRIPQAARSNLTNLRSGIADVRPFEIWTYDLRGDEFIARHAMNEVASGLKFVFVDDHGYGEYTLRYSSTTGIH